LLGMVGTYTIGAAIHVLLVIAVVLFSGRYHLRSSHHSLAARQRRDVPATVGSRARRPPGAAGWDQVELGLTGDGYGRFTGRDVAEVVRLCCKEPRDSRK
jgi:hypothetical protein